MGVRHAPSGHAQAVERGNGSKAKMPIYFAGSIRAGRDDVPVYAELITRLKDIAPVLTEHVGDYGLSLTGQTHLSDRFIHDRDLEWLRASQVVVAEVTHASLGVGYEIATAVAQSIPVIALYRGETSNLSAMIAGSPGVRLIPYTGLDDAWTRLRAELAGLGLASEGAA